ncbi:hypothetical protein, partial [Pseudopedobacter sp.]|uniref:hypothetical protein n=1 Tax=Pseudopedobacter sp. TaxID=1936787 RepID=UPI00333EC784
IYLKEYGSLDLKKSYTLLRSYIIANNKSKIYPKGLFKEFISGVWKEIVFSVTSKNQPPFWYLKKDLFSWKVFTIKDLLRILKKSFR